MKKNSDPLKGVKVLLIFEPEALEREHKTEAISAVLTPGCLNTYNWSETFPQGLSHFDVVVIDGDHFDAVRAVIVVRCHFPMAKIIVGTNVPFWAWAVNPVSCGAFYAPLWCTQGTIKESLKFVLTGSIIPLEWSVEGLGLSTRTYNALRRFFSWKYSNIQLIPLWEVTSRTETEMLAIPNFGPACLEDLKTKLSQRGLKLRG